MTDLVLGRRRRLRRKTKFTQAEEANLRSEFKGITFAEI